MPNLASKRAQKDQGDACKEGAICGKTHGLVTRAWASTVDHF
jgi:hypothetical protein